MEPDGQAGEWPFQFFWGKREGRSPWLSQVTRPDALARGRGNPCPTVPPPPRRSDAARKPPALRDLAPGQGSDDALVASSITKLLRALIALTLDPSPLLAVTNRTHPGHKLPPYHASY